MPRGGVEQVVAADDVGDLHVGVIDDDGELIGRCAIVFGDDEIAELGGDVELLGTGEVVGELDDAVGDGKAQGGWAAGTFLGFFELFEFPPAGTGINADAVFGMRGAGGLGDFAATTDAGIGEVIFD